ncbi:MAG: hypothetical protein ACUVQP_11805 [Bacteroidales bacterium]
MKLSIKLIERNHEYIATCPELDISCYASNKNEAIKRIQNILFFYMQSAQELGFSVESFETIDVDGTHYFINNDILPPSNQILH